MTCERISPRGWQYGGWQYVLLVLVVVVFIVAGAIGVQLYGNRSQDVPAGQANISKDKPELAITPEQKAPPLLK